MLERFIQERKQAPISERFSDRLEQTVRTFDSLVDYLRNPDFFPNNEINQLVTLMWRLIGNKHIPVALDPYGDVPSISFALFAYQIQRQPLIILPQNFLELTKEAPEVQIGAFAFIASQCRDSFCNKITADNSEEINRRAQAYEAEALLTLQRLAGEEGLVLRLIPSQEETLRHFPNGLKDLEPDLVYETPQYTLFQSRLN